MIDYYFKVNINKNYDTFCYGTDKKVPLCYQYVN